MKFICLKVRMLIQSSFSLTNSALVVGFSQAQYVVQQFQLNVSVSVEISSGVLAEGVVLALNFRTQDREENNPANGT